MGYKRWTIQLMDHNGRNIGTTGGLVKVVDQGGTLKKTLYSDKDGTSLANPFAPTRGRIEFFTADTVNDLDIYGIAPGGQAFSILDMDASGPNEIRIDTDRKHQVLQIPMNQADFTAAAETDTGFDEPSNALILPNPSIRVLAVDATETLDVGTLSSDSGDADGFLDGVALDTLGVVKGTVLNSGNTMGALFEVQDSANAGDIAPEARVSGGKSITVTSTTGSDTGSFIINLPYLLCA